MCQPKKMPCHLVGFDNPKFEIPSIFHIEINKIKEALSCA